MAYVEEIAERIAAAPPDREDVVKKFQLHANEVLDCLMVDDFFETFVSREVRFQDQRYFEQLRKSSRSSLQALI
jgi:hypothetical protein